ncbi:MAG TPA: MFS transporter [Candidatus Binatia bacterium]
MPPKVPPEEAEARPDEAPPAKPGAARWNPVEALLRLRALEALGYREFRLLWYGQVFTSMATWMDSIARGWLIYELTNSSFQLGLVRGVQAIPTLLLSPIAGSAADLYSRKTQILIAQVVDGLLYAWVALMILTGDIQPWHVYVTSLGLATVQAFQLPSRSAMVSDSVPPACLTNAMGLNAVVFNSARSAGPALAGILIAFYGTAGSYSVQASFFLLATVWTIMLRPKQQISSARRAHAEAGESFGQNILEGWKFSWRNYEVRVGLLVVSVAMFLLIPFTTLLPVFARDILQVGAHGQGILLTCMGVGALFSSVLVAFLGRPHAPRRSDDRRRRAVRRLARGFFVFVFVSALDVHDRPVPRDLPCLDSNHYPILFAFGVSRQDYGDLSHDPGDPGDGRHVHRRTGVMDRRALGGDLDESRGHDGDDRHLYADAAGAADQVNSFGRGSTIDDR